MVERLEFFTAHLVKPGMICRAVQDAGVSFGRCIWPVGYIDGSMGV